jgi:hypothetical protein
MPALRSQEKYSTPMIETRPLFTDLGELAKAITIGIENASLNGVQAKAVHVNPRMKEIMDMLAGKTIVRISRFPIVANAKTPMDKFWVEKL